MVLAPRMCTCIHRLQWQPREPANRCMHSPVMSAHHCDHGCAPSSARARMLRRQGPRNRLPKPSGKRMPKRQIASSLNDREAHLRALAHATAQPEVGVTLTWRELAEAPQQTPRAVSMLAKPCSLCMHRGFLKGLTQHNVCCASLGVARDVTWLCMHWPPWQGLWPTSRTCVVQLDRFSYALPTSQVWRQPCICQPERHALGACMPASCPTDAL